MPKYRLLTQQELQEFEKEFVEYLIVNGITADDWEKLKKEEKDKADNILDLFSDVVFETVLRKIEFLEFKDNKEVRCFQCLPDKIILIGLKGPLGKDLDLSNHSNLTSSRLKIYSTEKPYSKPREEELFQMTEAGCTISDGKLFKALFMAKAAQS